MTHIGGSLYIGHESDQGLGFRPTYGGVDPLMQQLIGETPEGAGRFLGEDPSWTGLGPVRDPRTAQQVQERGFATTRPPFTGVSDIYDALAAKQISRAQAQAYLERLMTPAQARNLLDENFPVGTEEPEPVSAAATPRWNTPSEVYASVRDNPTLYWEGVEALVGMGRDRGGSMDYLGTLYDDYPGGVNGGPTRDQTLDAEGALRQQAAAAEGRAYKGFDQPYQTSGRIDPFSRGEELDLQRQTDPGAVYSRIMQTIPGFSEFSPGVQGAIENRFGDVFTRARLAQVAQPTLGFEEFLGGAGAFGRGDPNLLRRQLHGLQSFLGSPSGTDFGYQTGIREAFDKPENILSAILQPGLAEIAPSLRGYFAKGAGREFERFRASQPEADVLGEFARRKFF